MTNIFEQVHFREKSMSDLHSGIQRPLKSIQEKSQSIYIPRQLTCSCQDQS